MNKILVADEMHESITDLLSEIGYSCDYHPNIDRSGILAIIDQYMGLIIRSKTKVDKELIDRGLELKFVGRAGAGVDNIDVLLLREKSIALYNAPEGNRDALGEHAVGMILSLLHKIHSSDLEIRQRRWRREPNRGFELGCMTVGIFGFGYMGSAFAQKLSGFGCQVIGYDKYKKDFASEHVKEVDFDQFIAKTEILSIHVPLTEETKNLIDRKWLEQFTRLRYLINTARGEVLVLKDLLHMLDQGNIHGAAFDVLENEKFDKYSPDQDQTFDQLSKRNNVLFTPHVGGWTFESYARINKVLVEKINAGNHL
jgi:D-3-phosphoglycerate dehydrogenase